MDWNWNKLPESEHGTVIAHVEAGRWSEVSKLCEKYGVSAWCCCNQEGLQNWVRWAIDTGIIQSDEQTRPAQMADRSD